MVTILKLASTKYSTWLVLTHHNFGLFFDQNYQLHISTRGLINNEQQQALISNVYIFLFLHSFCSLVVRTHVSDDDIDNSIGNVVFGLKK